MDEFVALPEASRNAKTTPDRARYWLSLLGIETFKNGRSRFVPFFAVALLRSMAELIGQGIAPAEAAKRAQAEGPSVVSPLALTPQVPVFSAGDDRLASLEKAVMTMAGSFQAMAEENKALRLELASIKTSLLPPPPPAKVVIPWQPPPFEDPLAGKSWLECAWIKLLHPEQCRRHPN